MNDDIEARPEDSADPAIANEYHPTARSRLRPPGCRAIPFRERLRKIGFFGVGCVLGIGIVLLGWMFVSEVMGKIEARKEKERAAVEAQAAQTKKEELVRKLVKERLIAPASSRFDPPNEWRWDGNKVHGNVHSQNINGALLTEMFEVNLNWVDHYGNASASAVHFVGEEYAGYKKRDELIYHPHNGSSRFE